METLVHQCDTYGHTIDKHTALMYIRASIHQFCNNKRMRLAVIGKSKLQKLQISTTYQSCQLSKINMPVKFSKQQDLVIIKPLIAIL